MSKQYITPQQQHELGWDIFPMLAGQKGAYAHFQPDGSTAPTRWGADSGWERLSRDDVDRLWPGDGRHNIGLATGQRSGVWVLDVDLDLEEEAEAREYVMEMTGIEFGQTLSVQTASGKWHFYFKMPSDVRVKNSAGALAPWVDVRGDGGMAMGIGSSVRDDSGEVSHYGIVTMVEPAYAPVALLDRVKQRETVPSVEVPASQEKEVDEVADTIGQGWVEAELQRLRDLERPWREGAGWHNTCFEVACQLSELANSPWLSTTPEDMLGRYLEAAPGVERKWNPRKEWAEGVKKTEGKGRAKPRAAIPMDWFDEAAGEAPGGSDDGGYDQEVTLDGPHAWEDVIDPIQESGATFHLANQIRKVVPLRQGMRTLGSYDGVWHYWEGSYWAECQPNDVIDFVARNLANVKIESRGDDGKVETKSLSPTMSKVRDVTEALATLLRRRVGDESDGLVVYTKNGPLTVTQDGHQHVPASPAQFNRSALPFGYDPTATCPQWEAFLADIFEHDPEAVFALQEWFGYFLAGDPGWQQKMFWLIGPKRSGKGTILEVARSLMGNSATATSLTMLSKDFGRENLIDKSLAIIDDARDPDPRLAHSVVEFLLTLSSGGFTTIARKHRRNWDGIVSASLFAASNTIPRMPDDGGAISSRLEVIKTRKSFIGHEDTHLIDRLKTELPGILNWSLLGLGRLRERDRFTQAALAGQVREEVDSGATGATPAVQELLMAAPYEGMGVSKVDLRNAIAWWSEQQEDNWKPNRLSIKSAILAEYPDAEDRARAVTVDGRQIRGAWRGVVLKCRVCDAPAGWSTQSCGPECDLHLSDFTLRAVNS